MSEDVGKIPDGIFGELLFNRIVTLSSKLFVLLITSSPTLNLFKVNLGSFPASTSKKTYPHSS